MTSEPSHRPQNRPQNRPQYGAASDYRPDIDGLRAVSILAVVLFHAAPDVLHAGFIGVDVFFVISGYLIGGLISSELAAGTFRFSHFYGRRVRRLFPALILVLAFTIFVGWNVMSPDEFRLLGRHVEAAALFVSNFPLMGEIGYFDSDSHSKPLLHLWSLGIEEQFYLVWPLLTLLTWRSRRAFLLMTLAVTIASFALSVTSSDPALTFYAPWTRFWELTTGVLVAHLSPGFSAQWRESRRARTIVCAAGLALIAVAALFADPAAFPGWWAVLPVGGAALVVASGSDTVPGRAVLASRPMVFIGKISYPLYLWHWPLLVFARLACGSFPPPWLVAIMVSLAFLLAWLTYAFVELPLRHRLPSRLAIGLCVPLLAVLGVAGFAILRQDGIPDRRVVEVNRALMEQVRIPVAARMSDGSCAKAYGIEAAGPYVCQVNSPQPEMLIIGDSISMAFHSAIKAGAVAANAVLVATPGPSWYEAGCVTPEALEIWAQGGKNCQRVVRDALAILDRTPSIRFFVIAPFSANPFFNDPGRLRALRDAVLKRGRKPVYVGAPPGFFHPPEGCRPRRLSFLGLDLTGPSDILSCRDTRSNGELSVRFQQPVFREVARETPAGALFDTLPVFCDSDFCYQSDDRGPLYWWWGHLNERGSARLLAAFLPWLRTGGETGR
jgi:peptidoglycan/LPS O-acetylase OafA/YrhL